MNHFVAKFHRAMLVSRSRRSSRRFEQWRSAQAPATARQVPVFEVDAAWPKLPNNWVVGHVASVAVDRRDHVWMLHRPNTITEERQTAPRRRCSSSTRPGNSCKAWGGPGQGYDWPDSEHGIAVDYKDNVWIGGSAPVAPSLRTLDDDMLLKFDNKGKFLLQIGGRSVSKGNADTKACISQLTSSCGPRPMRHSSPTATATAA